MTNIDEMSINAIRVLSADAIQKANSSRGKTKSTFMTFICKRSKFSSW